MSGRDFVPTRADYPVGENWKELGQAVQVTKLPTSYTHYTDFESITVSTTVMQCSTRFRAGDFDKALITVEGAAVRFKIDEAPTATSGHLLNPGDTLELGSKDEIQNAQFIQVSSSGTLMVSYANELSQ